MKIRKFVENELDEEDIPKSVAKMKKNKQKREEEKSSIRKNKHMEEPNKSSHKKIKNAEIKNEEEPKKKSKIKKFIKIVIIIFISFLLINLLISTIRWRKLASDMLASKSSVVLDIEGNVIATIGDSKVKTTISSNEIPDNLKDAYIAIEDERFYKHHGVDGKRTIAATGSYIIHFGSSSFGGSTITQQLVKNMTGDSSNSIIRKVKEWWKAWNLEGCAEKDEIITCYLNTIYVGPNIYGVEAGAHYYFSKSATDLTLEECAFLAGINHSPNSYNPFSEENNSEKIKQRTKTVLSKMKELEQISNSDYNEAVKKVDEGLHFQKEEQEYGDGVYSYHTDALINEITKELAEKYKITQEFAENYLELSGAKIYSTQNSTIQSAIEQEFEKEKYQMASKIGGNPSQAAMVIIDHETGQVLGCVGGLGTKSESRPLNRATQSVRQTGSSIKPIAVVAPAIDKKIITAASIVDDTERDFSGGYHPIDYTAPLGKITVRRAIESSQNVPFVEIMEELTPKTSIKYLEKMGISTLTEKDESLALALGGLDQGISPLEMAGAYATLANDGQYIEPTFYTEIKRNNGKTLIKTKQSKKKVFSEEVAYIMQELLTQPITGNHGTATYCGINGIGIAAKTGTTDDNFDRWLCGFSPYYTCVCWYGYDQCESINYNNRNPSGLLWANVMAKIHIGLEEKRFEKPSKVVELTICDETGKKATTGCPHIHQEYFLKGTEPNLCDTHIGSEIINGSSYEEETEIVQSPQTEITAPEEENRNTVTKPTQTPTNNVKNETNNTVQETTKPQNITSSEPSIEPSQSIIPSQTPTQTPIESEKDTSKEEETTN